MRGHVPPDLSGQRIFTGGAEMFKANLQWFADFLRAGFFQFIGVDCRSKVGIRNFYQVFSAINSGNYQNDAVYNRPSNINANDSAALFQSLNAAFLSFRCSIVVGDYNIIRNWCIPVVPCAQKETGALSHFILDNDLIKLSMLPSRKILVIY